MKETKLEKDYKLPEPTTRSALKIIRPTPQGGLNVNLTYLCSLRCKYIVRKYVIFFIGCIQ